jgi:hypothetical protein
VLNVNSKSASFKNLAEGYQEQFREQIELATLILAFDFVAAHTSTQCLLALELRFDIASTPKAE